MDEIFKGTHSLKKEESGKPLKIGLIAAVSTGTAGGAERFVQALVQAFTGLGHDARIVEVAADEPTFETIIKNYDRASELDVSNFDVVVSTKAPSYAVHHPRHVLYLVHTVRVFDDLFHATFPDAGKEHYKQRAILHAREFEAMRDIKARFAIGHEVTNRLFRWKGLQAKVIHPPLGLDGFRAGPLGDYFFLPGRLHPWKRVDLLIKAVQQSTRSLKLYIAGTGEAERELKLLANGDPRIEFLGRISDEQLIELYAGALAVPFVPVHEDYGYVTLEAFASARTVVTCHDSGEPTRLVRHGETGLICRPDPESVRDALEWLFDHPERAREMGNRGHERLAGMSWRAVANTLVQAAFDPKLAALEDTLKVAVLDMQPIDPPVGGGRLRLLGLYHGLGEGIACTYVGSYDWPGERERRHALSPGLEEVDIPLSDEHHAAARALSAEAGGKTVIDISFGNLGTLSPNYIEAARTAIREADVVVFSHPWIYPLVENDLAPAQTVIYESHNVEGFLRAQLLDERNPREAELLDGVVENEYTLARRADLVLACSQEDLERFNRFYELSAEKLRVLPNGVMAFSISPPTFEEKTAAKIRLGIERWALAAIFIGSAYGPNVEAAEFIIQKLASAIPDALFIIAGGVGDAVHSSRSNVRITGSLDEETKRLWLRAADIAVNPMFSGSGTNIKMFDFMALGLPTVTTAVGARGIETAGRTPFIVVDSATSAFTEAIATLADQEIRNTHGQDARICVEEGYAWERISRLTGTLCRTRHRYSGQPLPLFSVIVPTYERHDQLDALMHYLQRQVERDFEVIIVDQSAREWPGKDIPYGFPLLYFHTPVKGAVRARNTGATLAQGQILAYTDDDCQPAADWLLNTRPYFNDKSVVGVEGMITSDHLHDPEWRPVTNVGFEGIGFMTANLLVRAECFRLLGGFDLAFDRPHFREDTDLGWRLQAFGEIPYAKDVEVFHPAQPRSETRESSDIRNRFFRKDALLYAKHPERYRELFFCERHYQRTDGFAENVLVGFAERGMIVPKWMREALDTRTSP